MWAFGSKGTIEALFLMPSKLFFGVWELLFYAVCQAIFWAGLAFWRQRRWWEQMLIDLFAIAAATNLLWHFPPLFSAAHVLARTGGDRPPLDASDFRQLLFTPEVFSLTVHVWLASLAVASLFAMVRLVGEASASWECDGAERTQLIARCARVGLVTSLVQVPVGVWVFLSLPQSSQNRIGGGNLLTTALFGVAILTVLALLHQLASLSMGSRESKRKQVWLSAALMFATVLLMVSALRHARQFASLPVGNHVVQTPIACDSFDLALAVNSLC